MPRDGSCWVVERRKCLASCCCCRRRMGRRVFGLEGIAQAYLLFFLSSLAGSAFLVTLRGFIHLFFSFSCFISVPLFSYLFLLPRASNSNSHIHLSFLPYSIFSLVSQSTFYHRRRGSQSDSHVGDTISGRIVIKRQTHLFFYESFLFSHSSQYEHVPPHYPHNIHRTQSHHTLTYPMRLRIIRMACAGYAALTTSLPTQYIHTMMNTYHQV